MPSECDSAYFFGEYGRLALSYPLLGPAAPDFRYGNLREGSDLYYLYISGVGTRGRGPGPVLNAGPIGLFHVM